MKQLYTVGFFVFLFNIFTGCTGQSTTNTTPQKNTGTKKLVGGGCDGCEIMYVGMPASINSTDTCVDWKEKGQKLLVTGIVYKRDGKTPAPGIIAAGDIQFTPSGRPHTRAIIYQPIYILLLKNLN